MSTGIGSTFGSATSALLLMLLHTMGSAISSAASLRKGRLTCLQFDLHLLFVTIAYYASWSPWHTDLLVETKQTVLGFSGPLFNEWALYGLKQASRA